MRGRQSVTIATSGPSPPVMPITFTIHRERRLVRARGAGNLCEHDIANYLAEVILRRIMDCDHLLDLGDARIIVRLDRLPSLADYLRGALHDQAPGRIAFVATEAADLDAVRRLEHLLTLLGLVAGTFRTPAEAEAWLDAGCDPPARQDHRKLFPP